METVDEIVAACILEAVETATLEAKTTPIAIGESVGHTDFEQYGSLNGILLAYDGDEAVIELLTGQIARFKSEGMVDTKRVYVLTDLYLLQMEQLLDTMYGLGVADTPGCNCTYCAAIFAAVGSESNANDNTASTSFAFDEVLKALKESEIK